MPPFFSTATNILLIKGNLKFGSRATAVSVAMSPRYLGGKYRSRLHPGRENARASFYGRLGVWNRAAPDRCHLLPVATSKLIMRCVYKLNFRCTPPFPLKMPSSTQLWYIRASAGRHVFLLDRLLDEDLAFVQAGVPDDVTLRSCTREFQMWRRWCKQIDRHWFQGRQMCFWWMLSTMSWK